MMRCQLLLLSLLCCLQTSWAQSNDEKKSVQLQATVSDSPPSIQLSWDNAVTATSDLEVYRRLAGETQWNVPIARLSPETVTYEDTEVESGTVYEYRLLRRHADGTGYGYLYSGISLPAPVRRGILLLVIDSSLLPALDAKIERYRKDVTADGWLVKSLVVDADDTDASVKQSISSLYQEAPQERHALFLLGHVPVPYSGEIFPDGHTDHDGAWPADVYYADLDGNWTDERVNTTDARREQNHNVPGDGKWDQSIIPSELELEVGRVDFDNLPSFEEDAVALTAQYLDKNHAFRRKHFSVPARGLIENNFRNFQEGFGQNGLKNFVTLVGSDSTYYRDYSQLTSNSYLFSYGCGAGNYRGASGIANTAGMASDSFQTVFTFLFGSYFGDWDVQDNFLRATLGSGTILVNAWAGRPNWALHPMGMGRSIGYCAKLTQNNSSFSYSSGFGNRSIHIALMGDPSLRMHILAAPVELTLEELPAGIQLTWAVAAEENIAGYHLYRRSSDDDFYDRISQELITDLVYLDSCPMTGDSLQYLVKTVRLEESPSGRFFNESSGTDAGIRVVLSRQVEASFEVMINGNEAEFTNQSTNAIDLFWDFGDGTTSSETNPVHAFADGTYDVLLVAKSACTIDSFRQQIIISTVGTQDLADLGIQLFPNPVKNGQLQITSSTSHAMVRIQLLDVLGRVKARYAFQNLQSETLDLSQWQDGIYLLQMDIDGNLVQEQIILQQR
ncbi:MAG: T9SS type A sorting domain-containing protein [Bacteroidota bacterium]